MGTPPIATFEMAASSLSSSSLGPPEINSLLWNTATTYGARHFRKPLASLILTVSLPLATGTCVPAADPDGVCVPVAFEDSLLVLRFSRPSLRAGCAVESDRLGVDWPLFEVDPRVSSFSLRTEAGSSEPFLTEVNCSWIGETCETEVLRLPGFEKW